MKLLKRIFDRCDPIGHNPNFREVHINVLREFENEEFIKSLIGIIPNFDGYRFYVDVSMETYDIEFRIEGKNLDIDKKCHIDLRDLGGLLKIKSVCLIEMGSLCFKGGRGSIGEVYFKDHSVSIINSDIGRAFVDLESNIINSSNAGSINNCEIESLVGVSQNVFGNSFIPMKIIDSHVSSVLCVENTYKFDFMGSVINSEIDLLGDSVFTPMTIPTYYYVNYANNSKFTVKNSGYSLLEFCVTSVINSKFELLKSKSTMRFYSDNSGSLNGCSIVGDAYVVLDLRLIDTYINMEDCHGRVLVQRTCEDIIAKNLTVYLDSNAVPMQNKMDVLETYLVFDRSNGKDRWVGALMNGFEKILDKRRCANIVNRFYECKKLLSFMSKGEDDKYQLLDFERRLAYSCFEEMKGVKNEH